MLNLKPSPLSEIKTEAKVLVVDDVAHNIQIVGTVLRQQGYAVFTATNGMQAIHIAKAKQPDCILLDIMMPDMDGYRVCEELKKDDTTKDIPVLFLTARTDHLDLMKGFLLGAADYITKPFDPAELIARVHTHVSMKLLLDQRQSIITELKQALDNVKTLSGLLPICSNCKKVRDDTGYWNQIETYIKEHSNADFSHGICPDCIRLLYPDVANTVLEKLEKKQTG